MGWQGSPPLQNSQREPCAGVVAGLTYGKTLPESIEIGTTLAASVIVSSDNVCPRFQPEELGLDILFF